MDQLTLSQNRIARIFYIDRHFRPACIVYTIDLGILAENASLPSLCEVTIHLFVWLVDFGFKEKKRKRK